MSAKVAKPFNSLRQRFPLDATVHKTIDDFEPHDYEDLVDRGFIEEAGRKPLPKPSKTASAPHSK